MVLWRSRAATAESTADPPAAAATPMSSLAGDGATSSSDNYPSDDHSDLDTHHQFDDDDDDDGDEGDHPASLLGSASDFCARNGLTDGGPASAMAYDDGGLLPPVHHHHHHQGEGMSIPGGVGGGLGSAATAPPLFPSLATAGGPIGGGVGPGGHHHHHHGQQGGQHPPPLNFPAGSNSNINSGNNKSSASSSGIWPPQQEKTKKMKRDRSGNATTGGGGHSGDRNVTRVDIYPNGESYVTSPDGTTTKTTATIQQGQSSSAPAPASPIFQFTSNPTAAAASGSVGGGGSHNNSAGVPPQTATAALNFGKGFAPGVGAQGIAAPPPSSNNSMSPATAPAVPLEVATGGSAGGNHDSSGGPIAADEGETSTTLSSSPLPWQPQTQTSTCEFTHTISNYSQKRDSGCKKAEYSSITTDSHGNKWRLIIYVNGNGRASNHHLSLFLQVADAEELPFGWNKAVSYVLTLEHPQGQSLGYAKRNPDKTFKLCPKAIDWGWSQFITSDRIQQEGYVHKNTLTVRASVTVKSSSVNIDPEDAELYLKCAVEEGNAEAVKICLGQEARVNCQFKDDLYTPLHTACSANNHGDNGNHGSSSSSSTPTNSNSTPGPISPGSLEVLDLLLERGADVNACNKWRETPLLIAANNGHVEAVKRLLQSGADPSLCSEAGWSALTFAAHKGYEEICGLLLAAQAPVNCRVTEDLSTPLHKACAGSKAGHVSAVQQLLEGNADVHALNKWRETPLLTAANHGQSQAVEALLRYGADPCKCTDTGWSPLSIAAYKGHDEVVRLLLEEGAPTEEDDPTLSALLQAATKGLPDTVMLLLRHGADHTVTTKKGDTALSILVEQNLIDAAVEMVTDYSASVPRCSRDRKKVQRARLLINLRLKQMQRDGTGPYCDDSDQGESDSEPENGMGRALHDDADSVGASPLVTRSKKKNKIKGSLPEIIAKAEADARAAEEALLLELEAEENAKSAKAAAIEGGSSKNRKKKLKKKEKERHQKMVAELLAQEEAEKEMDSEKAEEEVTSAVATAASSKHAQKFSSPAKKEKVVELSSQTVVQTQKGKKRQDITSSTTKRGSQNKEVSLPTSSAQTKKPSAAEAKLNLKWAEGKESKLKKVREVSLPSKSSEVTTTRRTSTSASNHHRTKAAQSTNRAAGATKKIPGDNPVQPKRIPGDNPVPPKKVPGDNPIQLKKIPGDTLVQPKKIPGDNPKVPIQQSRGQTAHQQKGAPTPTAAKNKRGWESKAPSQQPLSSSSAPVAKQKKSSKQPNHVKKSASSSAPVSTSKSPPPVLPSDTLGLLDKGEQQQQQPAPRLDESTHSTANSTSDSLPATPTPQKGSMASSNAATAASAQTLMSPDGGSQKVSVDDQLANMANDVLGFLDFDSSAQRKGSEAQAAAPGYSGSSSQASSITPPPSTPVATPAPAAPAPQLVSSISVELPSVSIFRLEKLNELFRHCSEARSTPPNNNPLCVIDDRTLRVVLYRWIIRASHGTDSFLDPVIPSWEDEDYLKQFLQRQFISESRRTSSENNAGIPSIEILRDAGEAMCKICLSLARDVVSFRSKCEEQVPTNWSDTHINVAGMEEGSNVIIEWSGTRLSIPFVVFNSLARRYVGERSKLMSAVFSAVRRHEILAAIADPNTTNMVCHLPVQSMECLTKGLGASLETWSDSVSVYGDNYFCAMFPDVDNAFGGLSPFGKEKGGGESVLEQAGGSVIVVAPPENSTSSQCIRKMVDMSEASANLPLSFGVVLSSDCFVNANNNATLSIEDLRALDPRLCGEKKGLITFAEIIPAGSSTFSKTSCMFLLIQNEAGKIRFQTHPSAIDIIRRSLRSDMGNIGIGNSNAPMMTNLPGMSGMEAQYDAVSSEAHFDAQMSSEAQFDATSFSPVEPQHQYGSAPQEVPLSSNPWGATGGGSVDSGYGDNNYRGRGHRGRLFELVGDEGEAEEDQGMNNILPGMLDSLNLNMFGSSNTNDEVDIEAISLMGIGLNGAMNSNYNQS